MSGRRSGNRIRGPQSALTDFLASHNISAAQIRQDYEDRRRRQVADEAAENDEGSNDATADPAQATTVSNAAPETTSKKKRKRATDEEEDDDSEPVKSKKSKTAKKDMKKPQKTPQKKKKHDSGEDEDSAYDTEDEAFVRAQYKKARPAPGQFSNCEECNKRFTVTPYSKTGPEGGLLCTPCGKAMAKDLKSEKKAVSKPVHRKRRAQESDKLDGLISRGSKTLTQMCIEKLVANHDEVSELGDLPAPLLDRLSAIFSKKRVLTSKTLPLFLQPSAAEVVLHDAANLDVDDYKQIFAVVPGLQRLVLGNACQFKDEVVDYMLERCTDIKDLQLYAPNLVTNAMWSRLFTELGNNLEVVKLKWLDAAFEDDNVAGMVLDCPSLRRLKLKTCRKLGEEAINAISQASTLEHLSLELSQQVSNYALINMIESLGPKLKTLSLEKFLDADDTVLEAIHDNCNSLTKLRFSNNDTASDAAFAALFTGWKNHPLAFADFNYFRDVEANNPDIKEEPIGLAASGFKALMAHSGSALRYLDIASCRHIELGAFLDVFNGNHTYPALEHINISFCNQVDTTLIAGIFKSCPSLKKLVAFGCFAVADVVVPNGVILIGVPRAQDAIEQFGTGLNVEDALRSMIEAAA